MVLTRYNTIHEFLLSNSLNSPLFRPKTILILLENYFRLNGQNIFRNAYFVLQNNINNEAYIYIYIISQHFVTLLLLFLCLDSPFPRKVDNHLNMKRKLNGLNHYLRFIKCPAKPIDLLLLLYYYSVPI